MGYLIAFTISDFTDTYDSEGNNEIRTDSYEVFIDGTEPQNKAAAIARYKELVERDDLYSASVCKIEESTEAHYTKRKKDLFQTPDLIPDKLKKIIDQYFPDGEDAIEYSLLEKMLKEFESHGYTFEYGLDGIPFNLKPILRPSKVIIQHRLYQYRDAEGNEWTVKQESLPKKKGTYSYWIAECAALKKSFREPTRKEVVALINLHGLF